MPPAAVSAATREGPEPVSEGHVPLALYRFTTSLSSSDTPPLQASKVYVIRVRPQVLPVDIDVAWLIQAAGNWCSELDRVRYLPPGQLLIRKFDPSPRNDYAILCQVQSTDPSAMCSMGMDSPVTITVYGNDRAKVEAFFMNLFCGKNHWLQVKREDMSMLTRGWVDHPHDLLFFSGSVHAAFGAWGKVLVEQQLSKMLNASSGSIEQDQPGY